jgi:hypothetical protein
MAMMAFAMLLAAASADPGIRIETVPGRGYQAVIGTFDSPDFQAVMARVQTEAVKRCGAQKVRFGRHHYDNRVDTARNVMLIENLRQAFFCFDPATDPYKPVPADWQASAEETANATLFVTRFLDLLNRGDAAGMAMMDPLIEITRQDWDQLRSGMVQSRDPGAGGMLNPQLRGWINNPEGATYPGAYAYFAVVDSHAGIAGTCGGVSVQRLRPNEYRIAQYDVQFISQALIDQQGLSDGEAARLCAR